MIGKVAVDGWAALYTVNRDLGEWAPVKGLCISTLLSII